MRLQLLGLAGAEVSASVLVTTEREGVIRPMYLFNAPEGLGRSALEHKVGTCPSSSIQPSCSVGVGAELSARKQRWNSSAPRPAGLTEPRLSLPRS